MKNQSTVKFLVDIPTNTVTSNASKSELAYCDTNIRKEEQYQEVIK